MPRAARLPCILTLLALAAGCAAIGGGSEGSALPIAASDRRSPERILRDFLDAWAPSDTDAGAATDYGAMYTLIAPQSQSLYPRADFQAHYEEVALELGLEGIHYSLGETTIQGAAASINYDLTLRTAGFGEITDSDRRARFLQVAGEGWRLAWSTQDILAGLAGNASIQLRSSRGGAREYLRLPGAAARRGEAAR